jgi:cytochrome c553
VKKFLKWTGFVVVALVGVALLGISWIYYASQSAVNRQYSLADDAKLVVPTDVAEIAEGRRLAQLTGCMHCHGDKLTGFAPLDIPNVARFVAPNISKLVPHYSDAQFVTVMRKGVKPDGRGVYFMPSEMFRHLGDQDVARILAWLRTVPAAEGITETTELRPIGRLIVAKGDFLSAPAMLEKLPATVGSHDVNDPVSRGRYLTMSLCSECHGQDLEGRPEAENAPPLSVAKAYSLEQFGRLLHDGVGAGNRPLTLMGDTARARFIALKPEEVAAMHAYLQSRT